MPVPQHVRDWRSAAKPGQIDEKEAAFKNKLRQLNQPTVSDSEKD